MMNRMFGRTPRTSAWFRKTSVSSASAGAAMQGDSARQAPAVPSVGVVRAQRCVPGARASSSRHPSTRSRSARASVRDCDRDRTPAPVRADGPLQRAAQLVETDRPLSEHPEGCAAGDHRDGLAVPAGGDHHRAHARGGQGNGTAAGLEGLFQCADRAGTAWRRGGRASACATRRQGKPASTIAWRAGRTMFEGSFETSTELAECCHRHRAAGRDHHHALLLEVAGIAQ